ncbi:hypothetical protein ACHAXR_004795 [Thalassiosira sp. AJA248-18]
MMMATEIPNGTTNKLAEGESNDTPNSKIMNDMEKPAGGGDAPLTRRKPSARRNRAANSLSNSLRADRRGGLASTQGRLSVSFIDQKGLSAATIGDILSDLEDDKDEPEASMEDLLSGDMKGRNGENLSSMTRRMQLTAIHSQRAVSFNVDPKDLEDPEED